MATSIQRLTMKYGQRRDSAGLIKNTIDVRLVGPGVNYFAQYPVNDYNEDSINRSAGRLGYIERQKWGPRCDDQLGLWHYPEIGHEFIFHEIKPEYIRFTVRMLEEYGKPLATMNFKIAREDFRAFLDAFEAGVNTNLRPDPITPTKRIC